MGNVLEPALVERGRDRFALARQMGIDHLIDTDAQVAAFEHIADSALPPRK